MYVAPRQNAPPSSAPPGVVINYDHPDSIGGRVVVSNPPLGTLAFIFVAIRVLIKWRVLKTWGWDDVFVVLALLFAIARIVVEVLNVKLYQFGIHVWDLRPENLEYIGNHQKNGIIIGDMLYFLGIMFTKLSVLMLYLKIFKINKTFRYLCYGLMAFTVVYLVIFFFLFAFNCNPVARSWHLVGWTGGGSCFDNIKTSYAVGGINIFTDLAILVLPLPLIYQLHLDFAHKIGLIAIFGTGILVVVCTIVREVVIVQTLRDADQTRTPISEVIWLTAELCVGIICACLPVMAPIYSSNLVSKFIPQSLRSYLRSLHDRRSASSGSVPKRSVPNELANPRSDSDIELIDAPQVRGYTNLESGNDKNYIRQTKAYSVKYTQNADGSKTPGATLEI